MVPKRFQFRKIALLLLNTIKYPKHSLKQKLFLVYILGRHLISYRSHVFAFYMDWTNTVLFQPFGANYWRCLSQFNCVPKISNQSFLDTSFFLFQRWGDTVCMAEYLSARYLGIANNLSVLLFIYIDFVSKFVLLVVSCNWWWSWGQGKDWQGKLFWYK